MGRKYIEVGSLGSIDGLLGMGAAVPVVLKAAHTGKLSYRHQDRVMVLQSLMLRAEAGSLAWLLVVDSGIHQKQQSRLVVGWEKQFCVYGEAQ